MFLKKLNQKNPKLIETALEFHQKHQILPDTFVVDVDQFLENAKKILEAAQSANIELYYMLKQIGRNPYLAKELERMGYRGAVVVDFKEAEVMMNNHLRIAHAGHLVQIPSAMVKRLVQYGCEYITIYSIDKMAEIEEAAKDIGVCQKILVRVIGTKDHIYSGQTAGFSLQELADVVNAAKNMSHIEIAGVDSFPCFLYDEVQKDIKPQENLATLFKAKRILEKLGCTIQNVNAPSATCVRTLTLMKEYPDITSAEPGHGLSGTTPYHAEQDATEIPCVLYLSEISHNFEGRAYFYGGGYYRRGHIENALVGKDLENLVSEKVLLPDIDSIDYHFGLKNRHQVGETVMMAFRFQVFVTRSDVCLIQGIHKGRLRILGIYDSLGRRK